MDNASYPVFPPRPEFRGESVLGIRVDDVDQSALTAEMARSMATGERLLVLHANAWLVTLADRQRDLRAKFHRADIVYADSVGIEWAVAVLTGMRPARSTAPMWIDGLGSLMAAQGSSIFWLGSTDATIRKAAETHAAATGVRVAGWHHGFFDKTPGSAENETVVDAINASGADFLVVNMGMPVQERWLVDNWDALDVTVGLTAGALADRVAGLFNRPPPWMTRWGLEWLARLVTQPRRLWRRYLIGLPAFGLQILGELAGNRRNRTLGARAAIARQTRWKRRA